MADDEGQDVSYHPGHGDPSEVTWRGHTFKAGETHRVKDPALLGALASNKFFNVRKKDDGRKPDDPKTADDHRRQFVEQIEGETTVEGLIRAFASERKRREDADAGDEDMNQLQTQLAPRIHQMRIREGMGDRQVAELWMKYGMCER